MAPLAAFIAVQCCECSAVQVKQEKKSSNKWSCVICRQRQFVRRVFARSGLARDVRLVVQQLNMSRGSTDLTPPAVEVRLPPEGPPKRTDWSEYLEDLGYQKESLGDDCEGDVEVITEVRTPHQVFGKMRERSKSSSDTSDIISSNSKLLKPTFTKRKASSSHPQGEDTVDAKRSKHPSGAASASKWSCYLEDDKSLIESGGRGEDDLLQDGLEGEQVEEDVHPDFM